MENKDEVYKTITRKSQLPSCVLDLVYFKKLFLSLKEINDRAVQYEKSLLQRKPDQSEEDFRKLQDYVTSLYKLTIQIFGSKGEYISTESSIIFTEDRLPDSITRIVFGNSFHYKYALNRDPLNYFNVIFDLTKPSFFDLSALPTEQTPNFSLVEVHGQDQTWVDGAYSTVMSSLEGRRKGSRWIHKPRLYDFFLYVLILPLSFYLLRKLEIFFAHYFAILSPVWQVAFYLYFFIIFVSFFVLLFKYARWLYPYLELKTSNTKGSTFHRAFFYLLLVGVLSGLISGLILDLSKSIFRH